MNKIIGITGLMGSGKTYISHEFEKLGAVLYNTDKAAKRVQENNDNLKYILIDKFGQQYYIDGKVNSEFVRNLVFSGTDESYENLKWITDIVGSFVKNDFINFCIEFSDAPYILVESAILFESKFNQLCDKIINVRSANSMDIAILRDNINQEDWFIRMKTQIPEEEKQFDYIIENDYTDNVNNEILEIHNSIING
jgi:dephospho-CoA kinase